jgi:hypothetical protein
MCEKSNFETLKNSILNLLNKYEAKTFKSKITFEALDFASHRPFTEEQLREKAFVSYNGVKILIDNPLESFKYV